MKIYNIISTIGLFIASEAWAKKPKTEEEQIE